MLQPNRIICHYGELALKGGNRNFFEKKLQENIQKKLAAFLPSPIEKIRREYGRIVIELDFPNQKDLEKIQKNLGQVFGLVNFSMAFECDLDLESIKKMAVEIFEPLENKAETFRVSTRRSNKNFPLNSEEVNRQIGAFLVEKSGQKVSLKNPDQTLFLEITEKKVFLYLKKISAVGGLPVGTAGRALALLSGGLDSPVAAFYALKRGLNVNFIHFHSRPHTSAASVEKVFELAKKLQDFQAGSKIFSVPFAQVQKQIMLNCPESLRVILYRRAMLKISEAIGRKNKAGALITGDSLGQVASQTLENLSVVGEASNLLLLRPLITMDKEEIMQKARQIGTYDISILPHDDCCTRLMPKKPELHARLDQVLEAEKNLDMEKIIQDSLEKLEIIELK